MAAITIITTCRQAPGGTHNQHVVLQMLLLVFRQHNVNKIVVHCRSRAASSSVAVYVDQCNMATVKLNLQKLSGDKKLLVTC